MNLNWTKTTGWTRFQILAINGETWNFTRAVVFSMHLYKIGYFLLTKSAIEHLHKIGYGLPTTSVIEKIFEAQRPKTMLNGSLRRKAKESISCCADDAKLHLSKFNKAEPCGTIKPLLILEIHLSTRYIIKSDLAARRGVGLGTSFVN